MKKLIAVILALALVLSLSVTAFADSSDSDGDADDMVRLEGEYGAVELVRSGENPGRANPFYFKNPVVNCDHVRLSLSVTQRSGYCAANYYFYVKDADDNWHHAGVFRLKQNKVNGTAYRYEIDLDAKETFVAAALWPADKGVDCVGEFDFSVYVDPDCVGEYSDAIPQPVYSPVKADRELINIHVSSPSYTNPYGTNAAQAVSNYYDAYYSYYGAYYSAYYG